MPGFIGFPEILLLGLVVLILFGPKRLPEMGRSMGKGFREFKDSITGDNKDEHGFDAAKLELNDEMTADPAAPTSIVRPAEPAPVVVAHRDVA